MLSSPNKVYRNKSKLYAYNHPNVKSKQGLFMSSDKYTIKIGANSFTKIEKFKKIGSVGNLTYLASKYSSKKGSLVILDGDSNTFYCKHKIKYCGKSVIHKLKRNKQQLLSSQYIVDGLPTRFDLKEITELKGKIHSFSANLNKDLYERCSDQKESEYSMEVVPQNDTLDDDIVYYRDKASEVLNISNRINAISKKIDQGQAPRVRHMKGLITIFHQTGTMKSKRYQEIHENLCNLENQAKEREQSNSLQYSFHNLKPMKNQLPDGKTSLSHTAQNKKRVFPCGRCDAVFSSYKKLMVHDADLRRSGCDEHMRYDIFCPYWTSQRCDTHFFPSIQSKNHHQKHIHVNDIKKHRVIPNFEKHCYKCNEMVTVWKPALNEKKMGIRCGVCSLGLWIKKSYRNLKNKLNNEEIGIIKSQFKSVDELKQEFVGLNGEGPPVSGSGSGSNIGTDGTDSAGTTATTTYCAQAFVSSTERNHDLLECQLCKFLNNVIALFPTERDLKLHLRTHDK